MSGKKCLFWVSAFKRSDLHTVYYGYTEKSCGIWDENTWKCRQGKSLEGVNMGIGCKMFYWWVFRRISIKFFLRLYKQLWKILFAKFWEGLLHKVTDKLWFKLRLNSSSRKATLSFVNRPLKQSEIRNGDSGKVYTLERTALCLQMIQFSDIQCFYYLQSPTTTSLKVTSATKW